MDVIFYLAMKIGQILCYHKIIAVGIILVSFGIIIHTEISKNFLQSLSSKRKKNIRQDRKIIQPYIISKFYSGAEIYYRIIRKICTFFYEQTCQKFLWWGNQYLNVEFFKNLYPDFLHRILLNVIFEKKFQKNTSHGFFYC